MADRCAEADAAGVLHGQQGDLVVEIDEALDDHPALARASAGLRVIPRMLQVIDTAHHALALAGGTHHRLDHERVADRLGRVAVLRLVVAKAIARGGQLQLLGGQPADAFAVHREPGGARGGDHPQALLLQRDQGGRVDGLDLRHHQVGLLLLDQRAQRVAVEHVDDVAAMRHLHRRRVRVAIHRDHLHRIALQLDRHLLAQFPGAQQQHAQGMVGVRGAERFHGQIPWTKTHSKGCRRSSGRQPSGGGHL